MKHIIGPPSGKTRRLGTRPQARPAASAARPNPPAFPKPEIRAIAVAETPDASATAQASFVTVDEDYAGQRLDNFLIRQLKGVPKTHVYRIIRSGEVRVNKGRAQADTRVAAGDIVRLPPVRTSERADQ